MSELYVSNITKNIQTFEIPEYGSNGRPRNNTDSNGHLVPVKPMTRTITLKVGQQAVLKFENDSDKDIAIKRHLKNLISFKKITVFDAPQKTEKQADKIIEKIEASDSVKLEKTKKVKEKFIKGEKRKAEVNKKDPNQVAVEVEEKKK